MALPANISTRWVEGQFLTNVNDGPDPDQRPDGIAAQGTVTFVAAIPYLPDATSDSNPTTMLMIPRVAVLDDQGYICTPIRGTMTPAYRGIMLECTDDPDGGVVDWTWNVKYSFTPVDGVTPAIPSHSFPLPSSDVPLNLTPLVAVPSSAGIGKEQADVLAAAAQASAVQAANSAIRAVAAAEAALDAATATDGNISTLVETFGTSTNIAIEAIVDTKVAAGVIGAVEASDDAVGAFVGTPGTATSTAVAAQVAAATKDLKTLTPDPENPGLYFIGA